MIHQALFAAFVAIQAGGAGPAPPVVARNDTSALLSNLRVSQAAFLAQWRRAWYQSERIREPAARLREFSRYDPRMADLGCTYATDQPIPYVPDFAWGRDPADRLVHSVANTKHTLCPNWNPPDLPGFPPPAAGDERRGIDQALEPEFRANIRFARERLLEQFTLAAMRLPANDYIAGQRVRLLLDQGRLGGALGAARECRATAWWCAALRGHVLHLGGDIGGADDAFAESLAAMPDSTRCAWTDLSRVVQPRDRISFSSRPCGSRTALTDTTWWLADVLWSERGNDRRTEHFSRHVTVALKSATGLDERYNWYAEAGGDALAQMILRYGWQTFAYTGTGPVPVRFERPPPPKYGQVLLYRPKPKTPPLPVGPARSLGGTKTTHEYSLARIRALPPIAVQRDPFAGATLEWEMHAPSESMDRVLKWWPHEHYAPFRPFAKMDDRQTAFLRRDESALIAVATHPGDVPLGRRATDTLTAHLVVSTGPGAVELLRTTRVRLIDRVAFVAPVPRGRSLVSLEIPWSVDGGYGAHLRFAADPPAPLRTFGPHDLAISDPILLAAAPDLERLPTDPDSALALMRGSTTMSSATTAIGVYWETYGLSPNDSAEVALTVRRRATSVLGRIGGAVGVTQRLAPLVTTAWSEPSPGFTPHSIPAAVPIQVRSVVVNIETLGAGEYELEVAIATAGRETLRSTRSFVLR